MFKETHPILGTREIERAIGFYTKQLGFKLAFGDSSKPPNYVGFRRDSVVLHMQFQFEHEMGVIRLRILVEDPDALFSEYRQRGVECTSTGVRDTSWGDTGICSLRFGSQCADILPAAVILTRPNVGTTADTS